ncbi:helix-turn-helix domain-containing protein [Streptomyces klenkii]
MRDSMDILKQQILDPFPLAVTPEKVSRFRLLTGAEAAELAGVKPDCIRQWVKRGYLRPAARNFKSRAWLYREDHVLVVERDRRANQGGGRPAAPSTPAPSAGSSPVPWW